WTGPCSHVRRRPARRANDVGKPERIQSPRQIVLVLQLLQHSNTSGAPTIRSAGIAPDPERTIVIAIERRHLLKVFPLSRVEGPCEYAHIRDPARIVRKHDEKMIA